MKYRHGHETAATMTVSANLAVSCGGVFGIVGQCYFQAEVTREEEDKEDAG